MVQYLHSAWFLDGKTSLLTFDLYCSCLLVKFIFPTFTIRAISILLDGGSHMMPTRYRNYCNAIDICNPICMCIGGKIRVIYLRASSCCTILWGEAPTTQQPY